MRLTGFKLFVESVNISSYTSVYIDSSSWNRLFDDPSQDKIRKESKAIQDIINLIKTKQIGLIFSQALQEELIRHPEINRDARSLAREFIHRTPEINERGGQLHMRGLGEYDALHVASAEAGGADVLITSDDRMIKKARALNVNVKLVNPLDWLRASGLVKRVGLAQVG